MSLPGPSSTFRTNVSRNLTHSLSLYSMAAAAAGVSALSLAPPAAAEVVFTKAHLTISKEQGLNIDLNHDGVTDVALSIFAYQDFSPAFRCTFNIDANGGAIVAGPGASRFYASALPRGAKIGPSARFSTGAPSGAVIERSFGDYVTGRTTIRNFGGKWGHDLQNRYLGLKFLIHGETHYGWIRLNVTAGPRVFSLSGTITGYAYETIPNKPILTGTAESSLAVAPQAYEDGKNASGPSLGMLAAGADALPLWRREEAVNSK